MSTNMTIGRQLDMETMSFSKMSAMAYELHRHGDWLGLQYQMWILSDGMGIKSRQKVVGYPHNRNATLAPVGVSCLASY